MKLIIKLFIYFLTITNIINCHHWTNNTQKTNTNQKKETEKHLKKEQTELRNAFSQNERGSKQDLLAKLIKNERKLCKKNQKINNNKKENE